MENKYVIITPVRDEGKFIINTIDSVISQSERPQQWVIVDDGSEDNTKDIVADFVARFPWIKLLELPNRGKRMLGSGVVHAFNHGLQSLDATEYDFICKLDGDLTLPSDYFEYLFAKFDTNSKLGIASGCTYLKRNKKLVWERTYENHTRGMMKVYRKECFQDIDGLIPELGWDVVDDFQAQFLGWETRSFKELVVIHHRPVGSSVKGSLFGWIRGGQIQYLLNYHPIFAFCRCVYRMIED